MHLIAWTAIELENYIPNAEPDNVFTVDLEYEDEPSGYIKFQIQFLPNVKHVDEIVHEANPEELEDVEG